MNGTARSVYHCYTRADGSIQVSWWTNDDLDYGVPTEEASTSWTCKDKADFDRSVGRSRVGCIGTVVEVFLDGEKI